MSNKVLSSWVSTLADQRVVGLGKVLVYEIRGLQLIQSIDVCLLEGVFNGLSIEGLQVWLSWIGRIELN